MQVQQWTVDVGDGILTLLGTWESGGSGAFAQHVMLIYQLHWCLFVMSFTSLCV